MGKTMDLRPNIWLGPLVEHEVGNHRPQFTMQLVGAAHLMDADKATTFGKVIASPLWKPEAKPFGHVVGEGDNACPVIRDSVEHRLSSLNQVSHEHPRMKAHHERPVPGERM